MGPEVSTFITMFTHNFHSGSQSIHQFAQQFMYLTIFHLFV